MSAIASEGSYFVDQKQNPSWNQCHIQDQDPISITAPFSMPPLKAYERNAATSASSLHKILISGNHTPSEPSSPTKGKGRRQKSFLSQARGFLLLIGALTFFLAYKYSGRLADYMKSEDVGRVPFITGIAQAENKQSEQLKEVLDKINEINDRTTRAMTSLSSIMDRAKEQQSQVQSIEGKLDNVQAAAGSSASGNELLKQAQDMLGVLSRNFQEEVNKLAEHTSSLHRELKEEIGSKTKFLEGLQAGVGGKEGGRGGAGTILWALKDTADKIEKVTLRAEGMGKVAEAKVEEAMEKVGKVQTGLSERVEGKLLETMKKLEELHQEVVKRVDEHHKELVEKDVGQERALEAIKSQVMKGLRGDGRPSVQLQNQVKLQEDVISDLRSQVESLKAEKNTSSEDPGSLSGISASSVQKLSTGSFQKYGGYGYIRFSAYRLNRSSFVSIGLGLLAIREQRIANVCVWVAGSAKERGRLRIVYPNEHHNLMYETLILICEFNNSIERGGHLIAFLDHEPVLLYREQKTEVSLPLDPEEPFPSTLAVCTAPIHGKSVETRPVIEFMEYYQMQGANNFVVYDAGGISASMREYLNQKMEHGIVQLVDFAGVLKFETWYFGQLVALHDCVFRLRFRAKWVLMADYDEYIWVPTPQTSLFTVLDRYDGKAGISHGSMWYSYFKCRGREEHLQEMAENEDDLKALQAAPYEPDSEFLAENFIFRWPEPACHHNGENGIHYDPKICPLDKGHRKYFVNPRMVERLGIHGPVVGDEGKVAFADVSTDELLHTHYHALIGTGMLEFMCNETTPKSHDLAWWKWDPSFPKYARTLRLDYRCNFTSGGCVKLPPSSPSQLTTEKVEGGTDQ